MKLQNLNLPPLNPLSAFGFARVILFTFLLLSMTQPSNGQAAQDSNYECPAIIELADQLSRQVPDAEKTFWNIRKQKGTPLIEDVRDDQNSKLVTFVWNDSQDTVKTIAVKIWSRVFFSNQTMLDRCRLQQIPGSHTWFKTFKFRNDALFSYQFMVNGPVKAMIGFQSADWKSAMSRLTVDPYNKKYFSALEGASSVLDLDTLLNKIYYKKRADVKTGIIAALPFKSSILQNERMIWIYTPPDYSKEKKYPLYLFLDGHEDGVSGGIPVTTILDNLISEKKILPGIAVLVGNINMTVRGEEYLSNEKFGAFIVDELLNTLQKRYKFQSNADLNLICGSSLGGNAALFLALHHSEIFGNVVMQSGGFMYGKKFTPMDDRPELLMEEGFPEYEALADYVASSKPVRLKIHMDVGLMEDITWVLPLPRFGYPTLLISNRHLRNVLHARGYNVFYNEYNGGHESINWQRYLPQGIINLIGVR
jgi:enterochelin esterase-like enzyme